MSRRLNLRKSKRSSFRFTNALQWTYPIVGLLLLPLLGAFGLSTWRALGSFAGKLTTLWPIGAGAAAYALFQAFFRKPLGLYVFGHELTHALAAFLSGYKVKSFSVRASGGEVVLSDTNVFVALAPYCFPLYTILVVSVFLVARHYSVFSVPPFWCAFTVGFTFAFHVALTAHALRQAQPDLRLVGSFLSLVLILFGNGIVLLLMTKALFPQWISLKQFAAAFAANVLFAFDKSADAAMKLFQILK
ncbi:MAG: hypothetical protein HY548_08920 [Elusimicrobia bacterium]|nr:hypothetical protein [Elusimicrobiota bacterium]